jgi:DNA-binding response OmpR family regulator
LVVTDDESLREQAIFAFPSDVEVLTARDARDALAIMAERRPALVVADIQAGSSGGFGLAKEMAFDAALADIPILMLLERDQDVWLARQAGARRVRTKPIDSAELVRDALALTA